MKILNFGSLNIDHVYQVPSFVRPGETLASTAYQQYAGGKGCNQSIALARAGAPVYHAGCIGKDGEYLEQVLTEAGVDISLLGKIAGASGHAIIQVDPHGENAILLHGGANHHITPNLIENAFAAFGAGDVLLLQNELNATTAIIEKAAALGMIICFNPAPMTASVLTYPLAAVNYLFINESEAEILTGQTEPAAILAVCTQRWPHMAVILTLGAQGAWYSRGLSCQYMAAPVVKVVDTTAAGDTFIGYFISKFLFENQDVTYSLRQACQAAALCVTQKGAAGAIPTREQLAAFLAAS
jgi:ribokinase